MTQPGASPVASLRTGALLGPRCVGAARTEPGSRARNEDAFICRPEDGLFAVFDGMGGENGGAEAAAIAREVVGAEPDPVRALSAANDRVRQAARRSRGLEGMGCTASVLRVGHSTGLLAHVGDTRLYLVSDAGCERLTRDHTLGTQWQEENGVSEREARRLRGAGQLTRDVGGHERRDDGWIDRLTLDLHMGDLLFLCTDGLHGALDPEELAGRLLKAHREVVPPEELVDLLVERALAVSGDDNTTGVALRILGTGWGRFPSDSDDPRHDARDPDTDRVADPRARPFQSWWDRLRGRRRS